MLSTTWAVAALGCVALHLRITQAIDDTRLIQVVRAHLHFYGITSRDLNKVFAKFSRDVSEHLVPIRKLDTKHSAREDCYNFAFDFNVFFALCFCHR